MKYINATEVLPPGLLKEVQSYVKSGLLEMLNELGIIPEDLREKIAEEKDAEILKNYVKTAMRSSSIEEFMKAIS